MTKQNSLPLVSIITPAYNAADYIRSSIESVQKQTYQKWEMIIADDASTDGTADIVRQFAEKDERIRLLPLQGRIGAGRARNVAMQEAKGEFIAFLDSDDLWLENKLQAQVSYMLETGAPICCSQYRRISSDGSQTGHLIHVPTQVDYRDLLKSNPIACLTVVLNRQICGDIRFTGQGHEDYVLWLSLLRKGLKAHGVQQDLARYRVSEGSLSSNKLRAATWMWNIYRNIEQLNLLQSVWYFGNYVFSGLLKHRKL